MRISKIALFLSLLFVSLFASGQGVTPPPGPQFNPNRDLPLSVLSGSNTVGWGLGGNLGYGDLKGDYWFSPGGTNTASIWYNYNHDSGGGELQVNSNHSISFNLLGNGNAQMGASGSYSDWYIQYASSTSGLSSSFGYVGSPSGTLVKWETQFLATGSAAGSVTGYFPATIISGTGGQVISGPVIYNWDGVTGLAELGKNPPVPTLTSGTSIGIPVDLHLNEQAQVVILGTNATATFISGTTAYTSLPAGRYMSGSILVKEDAVGGHTFTPPSNAAFSGTYTLSSTLPLAVNLCHWRSFGDGYTYWDAPATFALPIDADAQTYITAAAITDTTTKAAINALVVGLKSYTMTSGSTLWTNAKTIGGIYPCPYVAASATNSIKVDLCGVHNATVSGTLAISGTGVTSDGSSGYMDIGFGPGSIPSQDSASIYAYSESQTIAAGHGLFGSFEGFNSRFFLQTATNLITGGGVNNNNNGACPLNPKGAGDYRVGMLWTRTTSTLSSLYLYYGSNTVQSLSDTTVSSSHSSSHFTVGQVNSGYSAWTWGFVYVGGGMSSSDGVALQSLVQAYQTALGRANP